MWLSDSDRQIAKIALPLVISNLSVPLVGLVDNAVLGNLASPIYLASVGLGAIIMSYVLFSFGFIKSITTGYTSQSDYKKNSDEMISNLYQILFISIFISIILVSLKSNIISFALSLLGGSEQININAQIYLEIRFWSIPAIFIRDIYIGYLIGIKRTPLAMMIIVIINLLNIILDYLFVYVFEMKVDGVAYASLISETSVILFIIYHIFKSPEFLNSKFLIQIINNLSILKGKIIVNGNMFIRSIVLMTCFIHFMSMSAEYGEIVLAANTILLNFFFIFSYGIDAFAHATEVMTGNSVGKKDIKMYDETVSSSFKLTFISLLVYAFVFIFLSSSIIHIVTSHTSVVSIANLNIVYLYVVVVFGSIAFCIDGIMIGALQHKKMRNIMIISGLVYLVLYLNLSGTAQEHIWYPFAAFFISRSLLLYSSLRSVRKELFNSKCYI